MPEHHVEVVILRDGEGNTYLLPWETLQQARVADEHTAEVAQLLGSDDVAGFGIDTLGSFGSLEGMRLQMNMDRSSKQFAALSNLLAGSSRVQGNITQHMK